MPPELIGLSFELGPLLKIPALLGAAFYIIFAFVIVKQVNKMTDTLEIGLEGLLRAIAIIHLLFSIGALLAVLVIL